MDSYGSAMMATSIGGAIGTMASAYTAISALNSQIKYQRQIFEMNQKIADLQIQDAYRRGETEMFNYARKASGVLGETRTAFAGQGVNVHKGSAQNVYESNAEQAMRDMLTIKSNTIREAYGIKSESLNLSSQSLMRTAETQGQKSLTLATAGSNLVNQAGMAYAYSQLKK